MMIEELKGIEEDREVVFSLQRLDRDAMLGLHEIIAELGMKYRPQSHFIMYTNCMYMYNDADVCMCDGVCGQDFIELHVTHRKILKTME